MRNLVLSEINVVADVTARAFPNPEDLQRALLDIDIDFKKEAASDRYPNMLSSFITWRNGRAELDSFMSFLAKQVQRKTDDLAIVRGFKPSWFCTFAAPDGLFDKCRGAGVFDHLADYDMYVEDQTDRPRNIQQSEVFVALVGDNFVKKPPLFQKEFFVRTKKICVLCFDEGSQRWCAEYFGQLKPESCEYWPIAASISNPVGARAALKAAQDNVQPQRLESKRHSIVVLGRPGKTSSGADPLVERNDTKLYNSLRSLSNERLVYWEDGWCQRSLAKAERETLFSSLPVFVRTALGEKIADEGFRERLKNDLLRAVGYDYLDDDKWESEVGKHLRYYWRPGGPDWHLDGPSDFDRLCTSSLVDLTKELASLAQFPRGADHRQPVRYEAPSHEILADREEANQLLRTELGRLGEPVPAPTQPITLHVAPEDNVLEFSPADLNIVAANDVAPQATSSTRIIEHFEQWEYAIQNALAKNLDEKPMILRIAVLFKGQGGPFSGLMFPDNYANLNHWYMVRCQKRGERLELDESNLKFIREQAKLMRTKVASARGVQPGANGE